MWDAWERISLSSYPNTEHIEHEFLPIEKSLGWNLKSNTFLAEDVVCMRRFREITTPREPVASN